MAAMTDVPHQELVLVSAPEIFTALYPRLILSAQRRQQPAKLRLLSMGPIALRARRLDTHTLEVNYDGGLLSTLAERLYRDERHPMKQGDRVELDGLSIAVGRVTSDGRPLSTTFTFAEPLDSPKLRWVVWQKDRYVPFTVPAHDGDVVDVPAARSTYSEG